MSGSVHSLQKVDIKAFYRNHSSRNVQQPWVCAAIELRCLCKLTLRVPSEFVLLQEISGFEIVCEDGS